MANMADTADIMANTANILARYRREADTSSAEAGRNSAAAHREHTETGVAVIGAAIGGIIDSSATDPSLSADLVIRTTGIGTHIGAGAILTRTRTTAIILMGIILRMGTIMIIRVAPYQESNSLGPDPSCDSRLRTFVRVRRWSVKLLKLFLQFGKNASLLLRPAIKALKGDNLPLEHSPQGNISQDLVNLLVGRRLQNEY